MSASRSPVVHGSHNFRWLRSCLSVSAMSTRLSNFGSRMVVGWIATVGAKVGANAPGTISAHHASGSPSGDGPLRKLTELAQFARRPAIRARVSERRTWPRPEARDNREASPTVVYCTPSYRALSHVTFSHCASPHGGHSARRTASSCLGWCHHNTLRAPCSPSATASTTVRQCHNSRRRWAQGMRALARGTARSDRTRHLVTLVSPFETRARRPAPL